MSTINIRYSLAYIIVVVRNDHWMHVYAHFNCVHRQQGGQLFSLQQRTVEWVS